MRKSQTPPKSEPKTTKNATKPKAENWRNVAYGTEPSKDKDKNGSRRQWMRKGQTPPKSEPKTTKKLRNPLKTKTKMALVGSGCEKAKHHLNPSPKRPKSYETGSGKLAKRCLRNLLKTSLDQRQKWISSAVDAKRPNTT